MMAHMNDKCMRRSCSEKCQAMIHTPEFQMTLDSVDQLKMVPFQKNSRDIKSKATRLTFWTPPFGSLPGLEVVWIQFVSDLQISSASFHQESDGVNESSMA